MAYAKDLEFMDSEIIESSKHRKEIEYASMAAHEMKVPIQTILTYSEMLKKDPYSGPRYAQSIIRNAKRLQTISKNMLSVSRMENHSIQLNKERIDLTDLICRTIDDIVPSFTKNYQNIQVLKPSTPVFVNADRDQIAQVISNLLSNAIKFTNDGLISVSVEKTRGGVMITVKDSGLGIDPAVLPLIFSKFVSTSAQGLGLGLFITKHIVEAHGGRIDAKNNSDGRGASFTFTLPA